MMEKITQPKSTIKIILLIVFVILVGYLIPISSPIIKKEMLLHKLKNENPNVRKQAIYELIKIKDEDVIESLHGLLWDEVPAVRWAVAKTLGETKDPNIVELLIVTLKDEAPYIRELAAYALGKAENMRAVEFLITALKDENENPFVRQKAAVALGKIRDTRAIEPLIATLKTFDLTLEEKVIEALTSIGTSTFKPLLANLKDSNHWNQKAIIKTLQKIKKLSSEK
ncbi:MAG: HEAT repeat domain-containing protein [bacterium]|nr:HEAT repeat domain-containing protein [bacterium]